MLRIGQRGIGACGQLLVTFATVGHNFKGVGGFVFGFAAHQFGFAPDLAGGLGFGIVAGNNGLVRHAFNQIAQAQAGDVLRQQQRHRLGFR